MYRKVMKKLIEWKNNTNRKPLILNGARQVGKTYILEEFGEKNYKETIYINFEEDFKVKRIFEENITPENIIKLLELYTKKKIKTKDTLIIFDEIQECDRALTSLKYFQEQANEYQIISAGSLLGVVINKEKQSFPVGKVDFEYLFPLDFEEYLMAIEEDELITNIKKCFNSNSSMDGFLHERALEKYKEYLYIGGMPAVVKKSIETNMDFDEIRREQNNIINSYIIDMSKYATPSQAVKNVNAFETIPLQLSKENHKFQYKLIKRGASATHFGESIDWLCSSRTVLKCQRIEHGKKPLIAQVDLSAFKLYMSDIGLFLAKSNLDAEDIFINFDDLKEFKGSITESFVASELSSKQHDLYYWESKSRAEIDFVIKTKEGIIPIVVKSAENTKSKSLGVYVERYKPKYSIRISAKNFGLENNIKSVPLYATFLI